jgi:hypothetical protein
LENFVYEGVALIGLCGLHGPERSNFFGKFFDWRIL